MIPDKDATREYLEARIAVRGATNPMAFVHLGNLYAKGIGTSENHILANYFFEKASAMGCKEADACIDQEYDSGRRDLVSEVMTAMDDADHISPFRINRLFTRIEKERIRKNYGILSYIREHIPFFYPDYDQEKAFDDILNNRDTRDADIGFSLCTGDNRSEVNMDLLESMLQQLFSPVIQNADLYQRIIMSDNLYLLDDSESELLQCLCNLRSSYDEICRCHNMVKREIAQVEGKDMFPYFRVSLIPLLRKQIFRCLLDIRELCPQINDFLGCLESDEQLLNICEEIEDQDLQLFLISYVEFNIDTDSILIDHQKLLRSIRNRDMSPLADRINAFVNKLTNIEIEHQLPEFTKDSIPKISLD